MQNRRDFISKIIAGSTALGCFGYTFAGWQNDYKTLLVRRKAKDTLTAIELNRDETLEFTLKDNTVWKMKIVSTHAEVISTNLKTLKVEDPKGKTDYRFSCHVLINDKPYVFEREVATQKSFYEPWVIDGVTIWFDAVDDIFENILTETHGVCRPARHARFALQDTRYGICPEKLHPWCPLPEGGLKIEMCYRGEDCWLGAYHGASAHGGLDINHPKGTPLWAPLDIHDHYYFNSVEMGHNNNRWRGIHRWKNGAEWILQSHHQYDLSFAEHTPFKKGKQYAKGAGVHVGAAEHSHFVFKIHDYGETVMLDPWILFRQMYIDNTK